MFKLSKTYALPFLRKCVILMNVRYGLDFPVDNNNAGDESELARLSRTLRIPSLDELLTDVVGSGPDNPMLEIISGWVKHWMIYREGTRPTPLSIHLSHPAIFELVGLPKNFDTLQDESMKRRCPTTGKDQTDPVVCLFCGEIFCSQGVCCKNENDKGGCWQHRFK